MKTYHYYLMVLCTVALIFYTFSTDANNSYPPPVNLKASDIKSCSVKLTWNSQPGATSYEVCYQIKGGTQSPAVNTGLDTLYTFTGLEEGAKYNLKVRADYAKKKRSNFSVLKITTASCSLPENPVAKVISPISAQITWTGCPSDNFQVRYKTLHAKNWIYVSCGSYMQTTLASLQADSSYSYQVCGCSDTSGNWTIQNTFTTSSRPNIVLILMDDARIKTYSCQHGPSFFHTPSIDRICNEGADFENNFVACSLCVPGRASLLTGLYPHHHGAIDLEDSIDAGIPTLPVILSDAGYYTAMVGKYHLSEDPAPGWDYWMSTTPGGSYWDKKYNVNGRTKKIAGHSTDVITDTAVAVINRVKGTFLLWVAYNAPHDPLEPQTQYLDSFVNDEMPMAGNLAPYNENYPSFLDKLPPPFYLAEDSVQATTRHYYQCVAGVDSAVKRIRETLDQKGLLDNTMIIVTSDNGRIIGEHGLNEKIFAYEQSIRTPIWIRYPRWFADSTKVKQYSMNVDVAPTILESAGILDTFHFDGVSLRKLATGEISRNNMMYEYLYSTSNYPTMPWMRGVRDDRYKYVNYGCTNVTEEFFDLQNDSLELNNLINDASMQTLIQQYRNQLSQLRAQYGDTVVETAINCDLANPLTSRASGEDFSRSESMSIYPNPASSYAIIQGTLNDEEENEAMLQVMNSFGQIVYSSAIICNGGRFRIQLNSKDLKTSGQYFVRVESTSTHLVQPFQVIK